MPHSLPNALLLRAMRRALHFDAESCEQYVREVLLSNAHRTVEQQAALITRHFALRGALAGALAGIELASAARLPRPTRPELHTSLIASIGELARPGFIRSGCVEQEVLDALTTHGASDGLFRRLGQVAWLLTRERTAQLVLRALRTRLPRTLRVRLLFAAPVVGAAWGYYDMHRAGRAAATRYAG